jgi:hypothetical protein
MADEFKLTDAERRLIEETREREARRTADEGARKTKAEQVDAVLNKSTSQWTREDAELIRGEIAEFAKEGR